MPGGEGDRWVGQSEPWSEDLSPKWSQGAELAGKRPGGLASAPCGETESPRLLSRLPVLFLSTSLETFQNLSKDGQGLYLTEEEVSCLALPETGDGAEPSPPGLPGPRGHFSLSISAVRPRPARLPAPLLQLLPLYIAAATLL